MPKTPRDENIFKVLNLLVLQLRARQQNFSGVSEIEQYVLTITEEHIAKEGLTTAVFLNTLTVLSEKGYLVATGFFEARSRKQIKDALRDGVIDQALDELSKIDFKTVAAQMAENMTTSGRAFDKEAFLKSNISLEQYSDIAKRVLAESDDSIVARVTLSPLRSINRLLERMNAGKSFDEIQEKYAWYDIDKYEFHIGDKVISTSYNGKPNVEHSILLKIRDNLNDGVIGYEEVSENSPNSLRQALIRFIDKDDHLKDIFTVHSGYLKFDKEYFS